MKLKSNLLLLIWVAFLFYHCRTVQKDATKTKTSSEATKQILTKEESKTIEEVATDRDLSESYETFTIQYPETFPADTLSWRPYYSFPLSDKYPIAVVPGTKIIIEKGSKQDNTKEVKKTDASEAKSKQANIQAKEEMKEKTSSKQVKGSNGWVIAGIIILLLLLAGCLLVVIKRKS